MRRMGLHNESSHKPHFRHREAAGRGDPWLDRAGRRARNGEL